MMKKKNSSPRFGFHAGIAGGLHNALLKAREYDCNAVQIFSRNPRGWTAKPLSDEDIERFQSVCAETQIEVLAIHACYLANLAASDAEILTKSRQAFREEIERGIKLKADYLIVHPGSSKGGCEADGVRTCAATLRAACEDLELGNLRVLIENTAGQGECIGHRFEHLRDIIALCPDLNLGICFDTAHAFAAGYNMRDADGLEATLAQLEKCVGIKNIPVVHFNDSKTICNSHVDRHANIGAGEIGSEAMQRIAAHRKFAGAVFLLETPQEPLANLARDVAALRSFVGG